MIDKCFQCGICCRLFLINLNEEEYKSGEYKTELKKFGLINDFKSAKAYGANILKQNKDGSCIYLKDKKCSIHKTRPQVCREFFCTSKLKKYKNMIEQIKKNNSKNYYIYLLRCSDNSLYCGQTNDLERRIKEHNSDKFKSAKYTKGRRPVKLVYFEKYKTVNEALKREYEIKKLSKKQKEALIKED
jgi:putative endonuclease